MLLYYFLGSSKGVRMMPKVIGDRLKEARESKNLKQVQVKERTGINNKTLSGYEKGVSEPDFETLKILADLYEVSIDWLTGRTDERSKILHDPVADILNDSLELSDEEIMEKINFTVDGEQIPPELIKEFLAYVRISRAKGK